MYPKPCTRLEVAVHQRQHAARRVAQHELPREEAALDARELALAQVQVVVALPEVPPARMGRGGRGSQRGLAPDGDPRTKFH